MPEKREERLAAPKPTGRAAGVIGQATGNQSQSPQRTEIANTFRPQTETVKNLGAPGKTRPVAESHLRYRGKADQVLARANGSPTRAFGVLSGVCSVCPKTFAAARRKKRSTAGATPPKSVAETPRPVAGPRHRPGRAAMWFAKTDVRAFQPTSACKVLDQISTRPPTSSTPGKPLGSSQAFERCRHGSSFSKSAAERSSRANS